MRTLRVTVCLILIASVTSYGQHFPDGIKYLGGPGFPDIEDIRDSWDNSLTIDDDSITLGFRKELIPNEVIPTSSVTRVTYGLATTRLARRPPGLLLGPVALLGIFHRSRQHRVMLEWVDEWTVTQESGIHLKQKRDRSILFQLHKDRFVAVLNDLTFRTGQPVYANAEDGEWLFNRGVPSELDDTPEPQEDEK